MRTLARIAIGAGIGCAVATAALVVLIGLLEWQHVTYEDMDLAYVSWGMLMTAPIVGGWWGWVRR